MPIDIFHDTTVKVVPPGEWGAIINYEDAIWHHPVQGDIARPPVPWEKDLCYILHYWGGATQAGSSDTDPGWTWKQKVAYYSFNAAATLRSGERYHIYTKGWRGIGYNGMFSPWLGVLYYGRGLTWNGAQWNTVQPWNNHSIALSFACGGTQVPHQRALLAFARLWLENPLPVITHRYTDIMDGRSPTACPGVFLIDWVAREGWVQALGVMRYRRGGLSSKGGRVKSLTLRLKRLGYLDKVYGVYRLEVKRAVEAFQAAHRLTVDGVVGPNTLRTLAEAKG